MKISPDRLARKDQKALQRELSRTLHAVKKAELYEQFVAQLLTQSEVVMVVRRILIAKRLLQGRTIKSIERELGAGQKTIETVHRWLKRDFEDYRMVLTNHNVHTPVLSHTFRWIRKKYPMHFLLLNLVLGDPSLPDYVPRRQRVMQ